MAHPSIFRGVPEFVVYRSSNGATIGGCPIPWLRSGEHLTESELIASYRKNEPKFRSGEFKAFRLTPVDFDVTVKVK